MLSDVLSAVDGSPAAYLDAARRLAGADRSSLRPVKVGMLSTFTIDSIEPYFIVEAAARGLAVEPFFGPFNQLELPLLDPSSAFRKFGAEVVVLATRVEELAPELVDGFVALSSAEIDAARQAVIGRIGGLIDSVRQHTGSRLLVCNFAAPRLAAAGLADAGLDRSQASVFQALNDDLARVCRRSPDVHVMDCARCVYDHGSRGWTDLRWLYRGRMPFAGSAQIAFGKLLARYCRALFTPPRKCLVLDLDNTLWGGLIGEDGMDGIRLGEDHPGNIFKAFQRAVLTLRDRGVLLAIASKNNLADAMEVLERHPDCLLRPRHFSAMQIHWDDKATSLKRIAGTLSIGTDALAFFDDSPIEREWVRSQMPEVAVIDVPEAPLGDVGALADSGCFDMLGLTAEDRKRAEMYAQEQVRTAFESQHGSVDDFLRTLEIRVTIGTVDGNTITRVAQLIGKTNQFNLTTRRHTPGDLDRMLREGAIALWLRAADRFGDSGLVGVAIALPDADGDWRIDTLLMSCRVIGRRIETALLAELSALVREAGGRRLIGEFVETERNGLAASVYRDHGFEPVNCAGRLWRLDLSTAPLARPDSVAIEREGAHGK